MHQLTTAFGSYTLARSATPNTNLSVANLRAWDAADEYILSYLAEQNLPAENANILLLNDSFGALACHLQAYTITSWSDSYIAHHATVHNLAFNQLPALPVLLKSSESPQGHYDTVIIKVPKTLALLEHQLDKLRSHISDKTTIIAAAMTKYLPVSFIRLFEQIIGTTTTSLAKKKARLIFSQFDSSQSTKEYRSPYPISYYNDELQLHFSNDANVFSREKLDLGTRFFLQQFDQLPAATTIVDLGCGDGVLGIVAQQKFPTARVYFTDESYMAVASAKRNYLRNIKLSNENSEPKSFANVENALDEYFISTDGLVNSPLNDIDLILCNPPFHQANAIGDHIAWPMFSQSFRTLIPGGQLWVVGNRHLNYHHKIKRIFGNCRTVAGNKKFVVLAAVKQAN